MQLNALSAEDTMSSALCLRKEANGQEYSRRPGNLESMHVPINRTLAHTVNSEDTGWRRGVVASVVRHMSEVTLRRAWLVLGWLTVFGRVYHHGM